MQWRLDGTNDALRSPIPWLALAGALALTAAGWLTLERARTSEARTQFERRTETAVAAVRARMLSYEQVLRSGAARIASAPTVSRPEWRDFIAHLQLTERFPGIQSIGFAERVTLSDRAAHLKRLRTEGFPDYEIRPPGERDEHFPIVFNEPFVGRNARVIGFDMFSEPTRRAAMERARDTADAAVSGKVVLAGEAFRGSQPQQPGFVMYVPVLHDATRGVAAGERRGAPAGFVFSPFRMHDLMRGILDEGVLQVLDMRVFDGAAMSAEAELIDTRTAWRVTPPGPLPELERVVAFPMPGRTWTIQFASRPEFDAVWKAQRPWWVPAGGLLAAAVVFLLTLALVKAWNRAQRLSMRDSLTGLYNRRYLVATMGRELPRARRAGQSVGVIVLDLDLFKQLNDTRGHDAGDYVLERMGELLRAATRESDIACRFGGEEFAVILPGATLDVARQRAEAIRAAFAAMSLEFGGRPLGPLTLSAGISALNPPDLDWAQVLQQADRALYTAKQAGRNRVLAAAPE